MPGKLDQSLEEIVKERRVIRPHVRRTGKPKVSTAGAITKTKTTKVNKASKPSGISTVPVPTAGDSKVIVSSLPVDVNEIMIKEYFSKIIGPVKKVILNYGPNGQSRGVATVIFRDPAGAIEAGQKLNGVKIDERPMKLEVVVAANQAPVPNPPKALGDRITSKSAAGKTQTKAKNVGKAGKVGRRQNVRQNGRPDGRGRNPGRPKPKTTEELDAEMTDYFGDSGAVGEVGNGVTQANGDTGMVDEIM